MPRLKPYKFTHFYNEFKDKEFNLLDVGAGSNSATKTKAVFPKCNYYGIDRDNYRNSDADFKAMTAYYEMDLTELKFDSIPDNHFDVLILSHVIEHLHNGDQVIRGLLSKLKKGGLIYVEFPGKKSLTLPSMPNTLNFYDDPTHVRVYSHQEIAGILKENGFSIINQGTRRYWPVILMLPLAIISEWRRHGFIPGGVFWDLLGFAEFVYGRK